MCYYTFFIPFNLANSLNMDVTFNVIGFTVLLIDMPIRAITAVTDAETLCLDRSEVLRHYIIKWVIIDVFSTIPFSIMLNNIITDDFKRWILLLRLMKLFRILEL